MVGPHLVNNQTAGLSDSYENSAGKDMATSAASDNDSLPSVSADDLNTSDEETWLFSSPRTNDISKEWLRKDLDDPSLHTVRHTLLNKLDEIANTPRQTPINTPNDTPRHTPYDTPKHTPNETPDISMCSSPNTSGLVTPDSPPYRGDLDTRTFVRPRKKKSSLPSSDNDRSIGLPNKRYSANLDGNREHIEDNNYSNEYPTCRIGGNTQSSGIRIQLHQRAGHGSGNVLAMSSGSLGSEDDDHLSSASEGSYCKIADVEDVNALARLQEESLKIPDNSRVSRAQEETRLSSARYKMSRLPAPRSGRVSAGSSQEDLLGAPVSRSVLPVHVSPCRGNLDARSGLSPPVSPYTSNSSLNTTTGGSNGLKLQAVGLSRPGDGYSSSGGSRGASPARELGAGATRRTRLPQVRGVVRSDRNKLASLGGIPRPSSSINNSPLHRPASQRPSGLRAPSGVTPPSRAPRVTPTPGIPAPTLKQQSDWREGCY